MIMPSTKWEAFCRWWLSVAYAAKPPPFLPLSGVICSLFVQRVTVHAIILERQWPDLGVGTIVIAITLYDFWLALHLMEWVTKAQVQMNGLVAESLHKNHLPDLGWELREEWATVGGFAHGGSPQLDEGRSGELSTSLCWCRLFPANLL